MTSYATIKSMIESRYSELKACGANKPGGGGFSAGNTCARGGKGGSSSSAAESKLDAEPRVSRSGSPKENGEWIKNPLSRTSESVETEMENRLSADRKLTDSSDMRDYLTTYGTFETVPVDLLESAQTIAKVDLVRSFIKKPPSSKDDVTRDQPITIVQFGTRLIVRDGNHRVVAEKFKGTEKVKARVIFVSPS